MAHNISAIITSFKYDGNLPNIVLMDKYHLIPFESDDVTKPSDQSNLPKDDITYDVREMIRDLSALGKCAYIETSYFGGLGVQISETWDKGIRIDGPLISYDGVENKMNYKDVTVVDYPINRALKNLGILKEEDKDEFDTIGLGKYRSNGKIMEEYHQDK